MKNIATKWSINESLLQSYRSIFISSQSFLIAAGAIFFDKSNLLLFILSGIGILIIWYIWFPVVVIRHRISDYYKYILDLPEEKINKLCTATDYAINKEARRKANKIFNLKQGEWRLTRIKVDILIPILFTIIWICMVVATIQVSA